MVTLKEVSINKSMIAPNARIGIKEANDPEFGIRNIESAANREPPKIKGILRPNLVHVLSLDKPIIGCTINPAIGAASQNKLKVST